jgi:hypothetical protein
MGKMHVTGFENAVHSNVESFIANLPEMLGSMAIDPRCLVAVCEFHDGRYVQFWVEPRGLVIAEVVSNLNIGDAVALSEDDEDVLRRMGWSEPSPGPNPNWRFESRDVSGLMRIVMMTRHAILEILRESSGNDVSLRTWEIERHNDRASDDVRSTARVHYQRSLREIAQQLDG